MYVGNLATSLKSNFIHKHCRMLCAVLKFCDARWGRHAGGGCGGGARTGRLLWMFQSEGESVKKKFKLIINAEFRLSVNNDEKRSGERFVRGCCTSLQYRPTLYYEFHCERVD